MTVCVVCTDCNNGWMATLEGTVAPLIRRMADGERIVLNTPQCRALALWMIKTLVMVDQAQPAGHRILVVDLLDAVRKQAPPRGGLSVWVGRTPEKAGIFTASRTFKIETEGIPTRTVLACTIVIGRMVLACVHHASPTPARIVRAAEAFQPVWPGAMLAPYPPSHPITRDQISMLPLLLATITTYGDELPNVVRVTDLAEQDDEATS